MDSGGDSADFYGKEAKQYDLKRYQSKAGHLWNELQLGVVNDFVRVTGIKSPVVMDLACGTGRFTIELAKYASHVYAVDKSIEMLEIAQKKCIFEGIIDKCTFIESDASLIDTNNNIVDLVVCINALSHIPHLSKVFDEVKRVLRPNGWFIFNYPNLSSILFPLGYNITRKKRAIFEDVYTRWLTRGEIEWLLNNNKFQLISKQGLILPTVLPMPELYKFRLFGGTFKNKTIVNLCPMIFALAESK